jgi:MFS family permease
MFFMENQNTQLSSSKRILGFNRNVFFLGLVSFFNDFSNEMVQSIMPVFLTSILGAPAFAVGLIEGVADALSSVFKLFSGWFSDKIGKRKAPAMWGYALSVSTRIFLTGVSTFGQILSLRVIDRVGKGLRDSPRDALIVESVDESELGKSFGLHRAMDTLGATVGPLIAFFALIYFANDFHKVFMIAFILGIFAIASFVFVKEKKKEGPIAVRKPKLDASVFRANKKFVDVVITIFVFGLGTLPIGLVLLRAKDIGLGNYANVPLGYFVYSLSFVIFALPIGKLSDKIGERMVIALGFLVAVASYAGLAWVSSVAGMFACFVLLGIYSAATDGMQRSLAAKMVHKELLATGQGFLNMAIGFSSLGAGIIGGALWTIYGAPSALIYAAGASLAGFVLFVYVTKKKPVILQS